MNASQNLDTSEVTAVRCTALRKHFGEGDARVEVLRGRQFIPWEQTLMQLRAQLI